MPGNWKRPESVPFPSVWSRFEGKREINGKIPKFWIQDLPEDMFETAIETMCSNFIFDEPLCKYSKLSADPDSVEEFIKAWRNVVQHKCAIICFMENPDKNGKPIIAGLNMTYISEKDEPSPEAKAKKWLKVINAMDYVYTIKDLFEELNIKAYMNALGLSVLPAFRGQGVGDELLKARTPLAKAIGITSTLTVFSSPAAQKVAERVGFKDLVSLTYDELEQKHPESTFPGIQQSSKCIRFMYKMF